MTDMTALAALLATVGDLAAMRTVEAATVAQRIAEATAIVAAGSGGQLAPGAARFGPEAVAQARAYLAESPDAHIADGVAHHLFNTLRAPIDGDPVTEHIAIEKIALLNAVPAMLDAEVAWRVAAKGSDVLATALGYWDRTDRLNAFDPLSVRILDTLQNANICSPELRAQIDAQCSVQRPGPITTALARADLADISCDDIREFIAPHLAGFGGNS